MASPMETQFGIAFVGAAEVHKANARALLDDLVHAWRRTNKKSKVYVAVPTDYFSETMFDLADWCVTGGHQLVLVGHAYSIKDPRWAQHLNDAEGNIFTIADVKALPTGLVSVAGLWSDSRLILVGDPNDDDDAYSGLVAAQDKGLSVRSLLTGLDEVNLQPETEETPDMTRRPVDDDYDDEEDDVEEDDEDAVYVDDEDDDEDDVEEDEEDEEDEEVPDDEDDVEEDDVEEDEEDEEVPDDEDDDEDEDPEEDESDEPDEDDEEDADDLDEDLDDVEDEDLDESEEDEDEEQDGDDEDLDDADSDMSEDEESDDDGEEEDVPEPQKRPADRKAPAAKKTTTKRTPAAKPAAEPSERPPGRLTEARLSRMAARDRAAFYELAAGYGVQPGRGIKLPTMINRVLEAASGAPSAKKADKPAAKAPVARATKPAGRPAAPKPDAPAPKGMTAQEKSDLETLVEASTAALKVARRLLRRA